MSFVACRELETAQSWTERFLNAVLNIVQEGTGTRCPLDTTYIHHDSKDESRCELKGEDLTARQVFERIIKHNQRLAHEDRFSTEPGDCQ